MIMVDRIASAMVLFIQKWGFIIFVLETALLMAGILFVIWELIWIYFILWTIEVLVGVPLIIWFHRRYQR